MRFQGGFCLGAVEGEGEVGGGVLEAVKVELDQRVATVPEEGFYEGEAVRRGMGGAG